MTIFLNPIQIPTRVQGVKNISIYTKVLIVCSNFSWKHPKFCALIMWNKQKKTRYYNIMKKI